MAGETKYFTNDVHPNTNASEPSKNPSMTLAYRTFGDPTNPAVFIPSCYGGKLASTLTLLYIPSDDDATPVLHKHFVVVCGLLGGSESSSPSNAPVALRGADFPEVTYEDNIRLQHAMCQALGITKLAAYIGFSMGGQQAYHMATLYPDFVERIVVLAGSARTSWHNWSFLEGPKAALVNSVDFLDGKYKTPAVRGTKAFSRVYGALFLPTKNSPHLFQICNVGLVSGLVSPTLLGDVGLSQPRRVFAGGVGRWLGSLGRARPSLHP